MNKTEKRFKKWFDASFPNPKMNFEEVAKASNIPDKFETTKPKLLKLVVLGAACAAVIVAGITVPIVALNHGGNANQNQSGFVYSVIVPGTYSFVRESIYAEDYSLKDASIVIADSEKESGLGEFAIPKTDYNSRMLGSFSHCLLSEYTFTFTKTISPSAFEYEACKDGKSLSMTIKGEGSNHIKIDISNNDSIYCSALFSS